jgi:hypothetical protein
MTAADISPGTVSSSHSRTIQHRAEKLTPPVSHGMLKMTLCQAVQAKMEDDINLYTLTSVLDRDELTSRSVRFILSSGESSRDADQ